MSDNNCGFPDGVEHAHVDACHRAGYAAGYGAARAEVADVIRPVIQHLVRVYAPLLRHLGLIDLDPAQVHAALVHERERRGGERDV